MREAFKVGQKVKPRGSRKSSQDNYFKNYEEPYVVIKVVSFGDEPYKELILSTPEGAHFHVWDDSMTASAKEEEYSLTF